MTKIRLKDIAEKTGVTVSTVSAALNGKGRISRGKQQMIHDAARRMGFQPNLAAKMLKTRNSNILGLVMSENLEYVAGHGVLSELQERFISECNTDLLRAHVEINRGQDLPLMLNDGLVGGIIHSGLISDALRSWLEEHKSFPFVAFEEEWEHCVLSEFSSGVFNAMQYLAATGHRRVALICGPNSCDIHSQTHRGFIDSVNEFGLESFENIIQHQLTTSGPEHDEENIKLLENIIEADKRPDALLLSGQKLVSTAIFYLLSRGIKIPDDISIVGICSGWEAQKIYPGVTAVERDSSTLTSEAIKMLLRISKGIECKDSVLRIPTGFKIRNTVKSKLK